MFWGIQYYRNISYGDSLALDRQQAIVGCNDYPYMRHSDSVC